MNGQSRTKDTSSRADNNCRMVVRLQAKILFHICRTKRNDVSSCMILRVVLYGTMIKLKFSLDSVLEFDLVRQSCVRSVL